MQLLERLRSWLFGIKLKRYLRKEQRKYKKDKIRCAKEYPDWVDDEFNMTDLKFIWGILPKGSRETTPSFVTFNDAIVYYNRKNEKYYFDFDYGFYDGGDRDSMLRMIEDLERVEAAFAAWLHENNNYTKPQGIICDNFFLKEVTCAEDLITLRFKVGILIDGLKRYVAFLFD